MLAEKYVDLNAEMFRSDLLLIPTTLIGSKHPCKLLLTNAFVVRRVEIILETKIALKLLK